MKFTMVQAGELMAKRTGSVNPANYSNETFELYSVPSFDIRKPEITVGKNIGSTKQIVETNDVLLCKIVPHIRRSWVVGKKNGHRMIASSEWIVFRASKFWPDYLRHFLVSDFFHARFMQTVSGVGGSLLRARPAEVAKIEIPLPPVPEQKRIADILDKADALREKRRQAIAKLDELLQSVFLDMFGDPMRNEKGFAIRSLKDFYLDNENGTKCGPFGSALKKHEYTESGIPVWNMDNISKKGKFLPKVHLWISEEKYETLCAYTAIDGDVLISRAGTVGKMCVLKSLNQKSIISTNLIRVRFGKGLLPLYFVSLMTYCKGRVGNLRTGSDGSFTHMNTGILDKLRFPYPPIYLQERYARITGKVNAYITFLLKDLSKLEVLFSSLQHRAFKGEL